MYRDSGGSESRRRSYRRTRTAEVARDRTAAVARTNRAAAARAEDERRAAAPRGQRGTVIQKTNGTAAAAKAGKKREQAQGVLGHIVPLNHALPVSALHCTSINANYTRKSAGGLIGRCPLDGWDASRPSLLKRQSGLVSFLSARANLNQLPVPCFLGPLSASLPYCEELRPAFQRNSTDRIIYPIPLKSSWHTS